MSVSAVGWGGVAAVGAAVVGRGSGCAVASGRYSVGFRTKPRPALLWK